MNWTEVNIYTTTEGIDPVCGCLLRIGVTGFVIKDAKDFLPAGTKCECGCTEFEKEKDIFDVLAYEFELLRCAKVPIVTAISYH